MSGLFKLTLQNRFTNFANHAAVSGKDHGAGADQKSRFSLVTSGAIVVAATLLSGCLATAPKSGGESATSASGSAGGANSANANAQLEKCTETLGTVRIDEQQDAPWYATYLSRWNTGSTVPALRLLIQQSNCFIIVDRGRGQAARNSEIALARGGEGRAGSNVGGGQIVIADYTLIPEVIVSERGSTQGGAGLGSLLGGRGGALLGLAGSFSVNEAGTILTMIDNRSTIQLAAAEGYAKNTDFGAIGGLFGGGAGVAGGAYTSTPQGKVLLASFFDAYNKLVVSVRNYKAQTVRGGPGTGGTLGVQGGSTEASKEVDQSLKPAKPATKAKPVTKPKPAAKQENGG